MDIIKLKVQKYLDMKKENCFGCGTMDCVADKNGLLGLGKVEKNLGSGLMVVKTYFAAWRFDLSNYSMVDGMTGKEVEVRRFVECPKYYSK